MFDFQKMLFFFKVKIRVCLVTFSKTVFFFFQKNKNKENTDNIFCLFLEHGEHFWFFFFFEKYEKHKD